jgi:diacylglycerol kinase (ATP)
MRSVAILYNPRSGSASSRRRADVEHAAAVFRNAGLRVEAQPTAGAGGAGEQARRFIADGFDTIVASGGDGTIHDVLQGMVDNDAALGVLPLGTANSLAADLGLARDPAKAAAQLLAATVENVAVGKIEFGPPGQRDCRYFTVAAGVGVDAALFYRMNAEFKRNWGMAAYVYESLRQWVVQKYHPFEVEWSDGEGPRRAVVTQLLAVRIADFGGVLNKLAPGADLLHDHLRLVLFKTASRARYFRFATGRLIGLDWTDRQIELVDATEVKCFPQEAAPATIHCEADGELLGRFPAQITIVPKALNLLIPPRP